MNLIIGLIVVAVPAMLVYLLFEGALWVERRDKSGSDKETRRILKKFQWFATVFACLLIAPLFFFPRAAKAGTVELNHDNNKSGSSLATLVVVGSLVPKVSNLVIADTTGYYELYPVGTTTKLGDVSVSTYAGVEGLKGVSAKPRGTVIVSYTAGPVSLTSLHGLAGVTGPWSKQTLSYTAGTATYSIVRHSVAGNGVRIDLRVGGATPYLQLLARRVTVGAVASF